MLVRRAAVVSAALLTLPLAAGPAAAAARPTHLGVAASPATVLIGGSVVLSGTATPALTGSTVVLQRAVGKTWTTLAKQKSTAAGTFAFHLKAPKSAATWALRVTRAAGGGDKAGVSATTHVRVVKTAYSVTASATLGATAGTVVVSGTAGPHATGTVALQSLVAGAWSPVATGTLASGAYSISTTLPTSATYTLRVVKAFTSTVAQGTSKAVTIAVPPPAPVINPVTLPKAVIGRAYSATLGATLGTAPYTWSVSGLPSGITVSTAGVVSGTSIVPGSYPITVSLTDAGGQKATLATTLVVLQTTVMAVGYNYAGEVGDGSTVDRPNPVPVKQLTGVTSMAGNGAAVIAVRADGTLWAWGDNGTGALGLPSVVAAAVPTPVVGLTSVIAVARTQSSSYALTADGTVWAAGGNDRGQLGDGTTAQSRVFAPVQQLGKAVAVAASVSTAYALLADGTVWAWGDNSNGRLGNGTTGGISTHPVQVIGLPRATAIATTYGGAYALLADGSVRSWGRGEDGLLGNGATIDSSVPVAPVGLTNVRTLANNEGSNGYVIKNDGTVWAWGPNGEGSVGDGTTTDRLSPVQVTGATGAVSIGAFAGGYAVMPDGTMRSWGENASGSLGLGDLVDIHPTPTTAPGLSGVVYTSASEATGFFVLAG